ncbi:hypothetical protein GVN22_19775 [Cellulophaga sp. BC115SP]|nr:hypothetical protein [Cellulophaga sp. BC115SP]
MSFWQPNRQKRSKRSGALFINDLMEDFGVRG